LLSNMRVLGINPKEIDIVVLSSIYKEHIGGLYNFLERNPEVVVYLPKSFPDSFQKEIETYGARVVEVRKHMKISENIYSTGEIGSWKREQSLILNTKKGLIVMGGCAHQGIMRSVEKAKKLIRGDILLVIGGFGPDSGRDILNLKKLGVRFASPCFCSQDKARREFSVDYGENFMRVWAGKIIGTDELYLESF